MTAETTLLKGVACLAILGLSFGSSTAQTSQTLPSPLIPVDAKTISGQGVSLDARVVVLDFFTSWCIPCGPEARQFERVQRRFRSKGVLIVGIDVKEDAARAAAFAKENRLTYPIIADNGTITRQYRAYGYPLAIIIDRRAGTLKRIEGEQGDLEEIVARFARGHE